MSCGRPLVYIGPGEGGRLVKNANAGFVLERGEPNAIAEAICQLAADHTAGGEHGAERSQIHRRDLSWPFLVNAGLKTSPAG